MRNLDVERSACDVNPLTGRQVSYLLSRQKSAAQRAVLAANLETVTSNISDLTDGQWARLFKVSIPTLNAARTLTPDQREQVRQGLRPLIEPEVVLAKGIRKCGPEKTWTLLCRDL